MFEELVAQGNDMVRRLNLEVGLPKGASENLPSEDRVSMKEAQAWHRSIEEKLKLNFGSDTFSRYELFVQLHREDDEGEPAERAIRMLKRILSLLNELDKRPSTLPGKVSEIVKENYMKMRIFLCHCSEDKLNVRQLYHRLRNDGFDPWLDEENLLPGQDWNHEITKAVRDSHIVLVCLSQRSEKRGYVQKEIVRALDVADEQPEGAIFLIPAKLEQCKIPDRLSKWQCVDLSSDTGYDKLLAALMAASKNILGN